MASGDGNSVSAAWARIVARELRKAGVDLDSALREAGLEMRTVNNEDAWIPYARHAALVEIAARELKDDCYGAKLGARIDPRETDALFYMGAACRTLEDGLRNLSDTAMSSPKRSASGSRSRGTGRGSLRSPWIRLFHVSAKRLSLA